MRVAPFHTWQSYKIWHVHATISTKFTDQISGNFDHPSKSYGGPKAPYTLKIRMFEKSTLVTSDQLETFRTPPELQEKGAKQFQSQNKEFFMILEPVSKLAIFGSFLVCKIHRRSREPLMSTSQLSSNKDLMCSKFQDN